MIRQTWQTGGSYGIYNVENSMDNRQYDRSSLEGAAVLFQRLFCDMGWEYGTPERSERELVRQHKDMIPGFDLSQRTVSLEQAERNYDRLDQAERDKDSAPMECMLAMLRMFDGLRIYRLR